MKDFEPTYIATRQPTRSNEKNTVGGGVKRLLKNSSLINTEGAPVKPIYRILSPLIITGKCSNIGIIAVVSAGDLLTKNTDWQLNIGFLMSDPDPANPGTVPWNLLPMCHSVAGGSGGCNNEKFAFNPLDWLVRKLGQSRASEKLAEIEEYFEWVRQQVGQ